jgi:hypothetical protein
MAAAKIPLARGEYLAVPSDELYANQTKKISRAEYETSQEESEMIWAPLPQTLICTLLYFLLVEQNSPSFDIFATLKAIIIIGLPGYLVYAFQFTVLSWLRSEVFLSHDESTLPSQSGSDDSTLLSRNVCEGDPSLLLSVLAIIWYVLAPRFSDITREFDIVLFSKRVAYTQEQGHVYITNVLATPTKRLFVYIFVNLIELIFVFYAAYTLIGYL